MRKPLLAFMVISVLVIVSCNRKEQTSPAPAAKNESENSTAGAAAATAPVAAYDPGNAEATEDASLFAIKECVYSPENPTADDDVTIAPAIADGFSADESVRAAVTFSFRWIVQDREIAEARGDTLEKQFFKKFDWIQCWVRGNYNEMETAEFRAPVIRIQNSPPQLNPHPAGEFAAPGDFTYQIAASDPDNDALTYSLVAPLDLGIVLNPQSGLIRWRIDEEQAKKTEPLEIRFAVSDPDGGKVESSFTLKFASRESNQQ